MPLSSIPCSAAVISSKKVRTTISIRADADADLQSDAIDQFRPQHHSLLAGKKTARDALARQERTPLVTQRLNLLNCSIP
jgi:hypothetical protein